MVAQVAEEVHYPDGRVGLASTDEIAGSGYANGDLAPLPIERRTWTTYNYTALWIGMSHSIPTYLLASAAFGLSGANLPAVLRALVACVGFGMQTWIGGEGFSILIGAVDGNGW